MTIIATFYLLIYWSFPLCVKLYMIVFQKIENYLLWRYPRPIRARTRSYPSPPPPSPPISRYTCSVIEQLHHDTTSALPCCVLATPPQPHSCATQSLTLALALSHPGATLVPPWCYPSFTLALPQP
jgi:hypothetical protein